MNSKEKWFNYFIGIDTKRDEYQSQEIRRILANMALVLWMSIMILQFILMILDQINHETSAGTIGLFIINVTIPIYFYIQIGRQGLNVTEFSDVEEFRSFKRRALYRSLIGGAFLGLVAYFITSIILPLVMREAINAPNLRDIKAWSRREPWSASPTSISLYPAP